MSLTNAQLQAIKADILANSDLNSEPNTGDGAFAIAVKYNLQASPVFTIYKTHATITEVDDNIVASELAGLSSLNATRLQTLVMLSEGGLNPSVADRRTFFDDVFSGAGGAGTRAKLLILWKKLASRIQKLLSTGTGSDASPATLNSNVLDSYQINYTEVLEARNLS